MLELVAAIWIRIIQLPVVGKIKPLHGIKHVPDLVRISLIWRESCTIPLLKRIIKSIQTETVFSEILLKSPHHTETSF